jgi:hypothetical protein
MEATLGLLDKPRDLAITARLSFGQHRYLPEIHQDSVPVLVNAKVAGVHVGLHEH